MLVKFSTLAGGVWIECKPDQAEYHDDDRCFRFDDLGCAEYAFYRDLTSDNPAPRWYGFALKARDFTFA